MKKTFGWIKSAIAVAAAALGLAASAGVAKVGDTEYDTLAAAVEAAQAGDTITMLADSSGGASVAAGKAITIDLKGFVLTGQIEYKGDLTLTDSVGTGYIRNANSSALTGTGNLVLEANIGASGARCMDGVYATNGKVTIATDIKIYVYDGGVRCEGANLTITGEPTVDSMKDNFGTALSISGKSTVSIAGGTYWGDSALWGDYNGPNVTVTGGKFKSYDNDSVCFGGSGKDLTVAISGGIYSDDSAKEYLAAGYEVVDNSDPATKDDYPYSVVQEALPVAFLYKGEELVGGYSSIGKALDAYNGIAEAGAYVMTIKGGAETATVYEVADLEVRQSTTKVFTLKPAEGEKVTLKWANGKYASRIFNIYGGSTYTKFENVIFDGLDFDLTGGAVAVHMLGAWDGTKGDVYAKEKGYSTNGRYGSFVTIQNCTFVGKVDVSILLEAESGTNPSALTVRNCTGRDMGYVAQTYLSNNAGFGVKIENCHATNIKTFFNEVDGDGTVEIKNCSAVSHTDYCVRANAALAMSGCAFTNDCTYLKPEDGTQGAFVVLRTKDGSSGVLTISDTTFVDKSAEGYVIHDMQNANGAETTVTANGTVDGIAFENEKIKVAAKTYYDFKPPTVAKIGDDEYETLSNAVEAAVNGDTILLLEDNAEVFTVGVTTLFTINPNGHALTGNVTPKEGCEIVQNLDGTYGYRMAVEVKDQVSKNVVETKTESTDKTSAAVTVSDEYFEQLFSESGSKTLEFVAAGVGTVSFDSKAADRIGQNITNAVTKAGGAEESATTKTTLTVAIADVTDEVKPEKPKVIIVKEEVHEVVQAISVTAIMQSIIQRQGAEATVTTNEEIYAGSKADGKAKVTIWYSGLSPQVWFVDTTKPQWETNDMYTAYNADTKELTFEVEHFSDYVITDAETYAMVGVEKFRTLQEALGFVSTNQALGTTVTLNKTNELTAATLAENAMATIDLNGKAILGSVKALGGSVLTIVGEGTVDAGAGTFAEGEGSGKVNITSGIYKGVFPAEGATTNVFVSGGWFQTPVPAANCAPGYEPNATATAGLYTVKDANVYIRNIRAAQRYPWNGKMDIWVDVCWGDTEKAKLTVRAIDISDGVAKALTMTKAKLIEEGVAGEREVDCTTGFIVTTPTTAKKTLHLVWDSTEAVPRGTMAKKVRFTFTAN